MRTSYRQAIGRELSYPVGLADIQQALDAAPQSAELEVTFVRSPGTSVVRFRERIVRHEPSAVIHGRFTKLDKAPSRGDDLWLQELLRGKWELRVYPVSRDQRAYARSALIEYGLPALASWFGSKRSESWYHGRKVFEIIFDPIARRVHWEERVEAL